MQPLILCLLGPQLGDKLRGKYEYAGKAWSRAGALPGQSEGCSLPPDFPLTTSLAKGTLIRTDHSGQQPLLLI